jgi:hypothetical protein
VRIDTLANAVKRIDEQTPFNHVIKEFMDGVWLADDKQSLIEEQPDYVCINDKFCPDEAYNALLAGITDEMVVRFNLNRPDWVTLPQYTLDKPYFYCPDNPARRAILLVETPSFYRARNLFCGKVFLEKLGNV